MLPNHYSEGIDLIYWRAKLIPPRHTMVFVGEVGNGESIGRLESEVWSNVRFTIVLLSFMSSHGVTGEEIVFVPSKAIVDGIPLSSTLWFLWEDSNQRIGWMVRMARHPSDWCALFQRDFVSHQLQSPIAP